MDLVCVADLTVYKGEYYIQARLIDVEKAIVLATAREVSSLEDLNTVIKVAGNLAQKLIGTEVTYSLVVENTKGTPLDIYIAGEYIGQAAGKASPPSRCASTKSANSRPRPPKAFSKEKRNTTFLKSML